MDFEHPTQKTQDALPVEGLQFYVNNSYCNRDLIVCAKLVIFSYICKQKLIFVDI